MLEKDLDLSGSGRVTSGLGRMFETSGPFFHGDRSDHSKGKQLDVHSPGFDCQFMSWRDRGEHDDLQTWRDPRCRENMTPFELPGHASHALDICSGRFQVRALNRVGAGKRVRAS